MRRLVLLAVLAVLALPAVARAGISEYDIEPGAAAGTHVPLYLASGTDGTLVYADAGTTPQLGRMTTAGQRLAPVTLPSQPWTVLPRPGGSTMVSLATGVALVAADGTLSLTDARPAWGLAASSSEFLFLGTTTPANGYQVCVGEQCTPPTTTQARPLGLTQGPDDAVWATIYEADLILSVGPAGANVDRTVTLPPGSGPDGIVAGPDGALWATMFDADAVDRIALDGSRHRYPLPAGTEPDGIAVGAEGQLWIAGSHSDSILRMNMAGTVTGTWTTPTPASNPVGITAGADGAIWFTEANVGKLGRLVPEAPRDRGAGGGDDGDGDDDGDGEGDAGGDGEGRLGGAGATAPRFLRGLSVSPHRLHAGRAAHLTFTLSRPAVVRAAVTRSVRGRRTGTRCAARTSANQAGRTCTRQVVVRSLRHRAAKGATSLTLRTTGLVPGRYRATVTATDDGGVTSRAAVVAFRVTAARR